MGCPSEVEIGDNLVFSVTTHDPDTGVLTDADSVPGYRIYEDETGTAILTGSMAKLDDANTTGFYTELIACTSGNGFENGKTYTVYITATVDGDQGGIAYGFKAYDQRKANTTQIEGSDATDQINAACDTALSDYDPPTKTEMDSGFAGLNDPTAAAIADAVLDEALSGHTTAGTLGKAVADVETDVTAILADTNELQTDDIPGTLATIAAYIDTEVAAIKAVTDNLPDSGALTSVATASALATLDSVADAIKAVTDQMVFTETNLLDVNALAISGSTDAADYLETGAESVLQVVIGTGSTTTTVKLSTVNGAAPSAVDDYYNGAYLVFTSGNLAGQRVQITDYTGSSTTLTISAATGSAANTDTAIIV